MLSLLESHNDFDLIFLDIQMEQPDGMITAKRLRQQGNHSLLVFVTVLKECVFSQTANFIIVLHISARLFVYIKFVDAMQTQTCHYE